jgi:hypothetical protein
VIYALIGGLALSASSAQAQETQQITCESRDNRRVECPVPENHEVRLVRTLGTAPCIPGRTYGAPAGKIWVSNGCRGVFEVKPPAPPVVKEPPSYLLRCESIRNQTADCPIDASGTVVLARTLSGAACTEGQSWVRVGGSLYVARGCRGEFEVTLPRRPVNFSRPTNTTYELTCGSYYDGRLSCRINPGDIVRLDRTLSRKSCVEGVSWGVGVNAVWVDEGCRAEFEVTKAQP